MQSETPNIPLAYHITWGTYGARLHGTEKPHVDHDHNEFGTPFAKPDPYRADEARARMKFAPVSLSGPQRATVVSTIEELSKRYGWTLHIIACQLDHGHVVMTADRVGPALRDTLKAVASRALNEHFEVRPWWAEGGSAKYIWDPRYLEAAIGYVERQKVI